MFYVHWGKVSILQKSQLSKIYQFLCGYGCIKRNKTDNIVFILMKFYTLVVKILLKHKINKVLYFLVKKVVFEQLKLSHLERIAFHRNGRW